MTEPMTETPKPVKCILALGSNLGERADTLSLAVADLVDRDDVRLCQVSQVVQTKPVGGPDGQPDFLNMVMEIETTLAPYELLAHCNEVEDKHHRVREVRWGPRTLDIDIITYGDLEMDEERLTIPHKLAAERAFVLQPWAWMDPDATLRGESVAVLAQKAVDAEGLAPYSPHDDMWESSS